MRPFFVLRASGSEVVSKGGKTYNLQGIFHFVSVCAKKHMACREKYKPYILKYKALISKYVPYIFCYNKPLKNNNL